jgi:hypothetical protein
LAWQGGSFNENDDGNENREVGLIFNFQFIYPCLAKNKIILLAGNNLSGRSNIIAYRDYKKSL